jgi:DNA repair protein SbcD/Mre11
MRAFRFLHAADLHLDSPFKGLSALPEPIRGTIRESTFESLRNLVQIAIDQKVDFVVMAGDIYYGADRSLRAQLRFQRAVEQLAERGIRVYIVHGNHDPDDGRKAALVWPQSVHFFSSKEPELVEAADRQGRVLAYIQGMSYPTSAVRDNIAALYSLRQRQDGLHIGLLHGNVDGDTGHDNYAPCTLQQLAGSGIHYWALGHIHIRRILREEPWVVYPGNIQGRSIRETGPKGCYVVDVSDTGRMRLQFHATDQVRWLVESVSIDGMASEQELRDETERVLEQCAVQADGRPSVVRLQVDGRGPLHHVLHSGNTLQELLGELRDEQLRRAERDGSTSWTWLESLPLRTGLNIDRERLLAQDGFLSDLLRSAGRLLEDERELELLCARALEPLLSHPKAGRLVSELLQDERADWLRAAEQLALGLVAEEEGWDA